MIRYLSTLPWLYILFFASISGAQQNIEAATVDDIIRSQVYASPEKLHYTISWSGGIKIGDLYMEITKDSGAKEQYTIHVRVKDSGIFHFFYPVDDTFVTVVRGPRRVPVTYDVEQNEGSSYHALRHTEYDQEKGIVRYQKNKGAVQTFQVEGEVHNEFSSFLFTRILRLDEGHPILVPTFADKKRNEVVVLLSGRKVVENELIGPVQALVVHPLMKFKGLYDKAGDTTLYFSDDICRVPVRINSKILIGSITAELAGYSSATCEHFPVHHLETP